MTETPSGNRWEPAGDGQPRPEAPRPVEPTAPVYGWAPVPPPAASAQVGRRGRRTGLLAGGALTVLLAAGAGGYAIGSATAGSGSPDVTTRQGPGGADPGPGFNGHDDDHDQPGGPDGSDGGTE